MDTIYSTKKCTKISVIITAYNHEKYINQCLDNVFKQLGDFTIEVILGDDCSTDNTRTIMQSYFDKYPDKCVLLPAQNNLGVTKNIKRCLDACTGDYIAFCEGDDYWTDKYKLQKQAEFLSGHQDYSMCCNAIILYNEEKDRYNIHFEQLQSKEDNWNIHEIIEQNRVCGLSSCMFSNKAIKKLPNDIFNLYVADWMLSISCARIGKVKFLRDWMSVYRIHSNGAWSGLSSIDQCKQLLQLIRVYNKYFNYEYNKQFKSRESFLRKYLLYQWFKRLILIIFHLLPISKISKNKSRSFSPNIDNQNSRLNVYKKYAPLKLNLGCGDVKLKGWVNIDILPTADLVLDINQGLPFDDNSVDVIYNEHFLEHLSLEEGESLLKECYRCLKDKGILRIAMPDLDYIINKYNGDWKNQDWLTWPAFSSIDTKGRMINTSFRSWGHRYLYNEEDIQHQLTKTGFNEIVRCKWNSSSYPELTGLETRKDSQLVIEAIK